MKQTCLWRKSGERGDTLRKVGSATCFKQLFSSTFGDKKSFWKKSKAGYAACFKRLQLNNNLNVANIQLKRQHFANVVDSLVSIKFEPLQNLQFAMALDLICLYWVTSFDLSPAGTTEHFVIVMMSSADNETSCGLDETFVISISSNFL